MYDQYPAIRERTREVQWAMLLQWENAGFLYTQYEQFLLLPLEMTSKYPPCLLGACLSREDGKLRAAEGWEGVLRKQTEVPALF